VKRVTGLAMTGEGRDVVERQLDEARSLYATGAALQEDDALGRHYTEQLLLLQTAICYCEAGDASQAVHLYQTALASGSFSYRDRGYFLSLMAKAIARAGDPDEACATGWEALAVARQTDSKRTKRELNRVCGLLEPWQRYRPVARELAEAVTNAM
jgi:tetratricopeptide (TPR) repeat protein